MKELASTRMSSRGQVVIPEDIRTTLNLKPGTQFIVLCEKDVVIFKIITPPTMNEFDSLIKKARKQATQAGMKKADVAAAITKVRKKR